MLAQDAVPADVAQTITLLVQKLSALKDDRTKLDAALKRLDTDVTPLRDKDVNAKSIAADLTKWLGDLSDVKKAAVQKDAAFIALFASTDRIQDANDFIRATRLANQLLNTLKNGRMKTDEWDSLATGLNDLSAEMEKFLKDRPVKIHIISATYGVIGTSRTCDARAYFRAKCEGQAKCPVPPDNKTDSAPLTINGSELCGYEPAPLAAPKDTKAVVQYACVRFGLRPWADIVRTESKGVGAVFVGKGQITCDFR